MIQPGTRVHPGAIDSLGAENLRVEYKDPSGPTVSTILLTGEESTAVDKLRRLMLRIRSRDWSEGALRRARFRIHVLEAN